MFQDRRGKQRTKAITILNDDISAVPNDAPEPRASVLLAAIAEDAREVARRTLRGKFGRLANLAILSRVRTAAAGSDTNVSDLEILDRWFGDYERAIVEFREARG